jgi:metal-sulfur cluster biosynthetic enzyme
MITIGEVQDALRGVADPCAIATGVPVDIVDMGLVQDITVSDHSVIVTLRLTSPFCMQIGLMSEQIETVLLRDPRLAVVQVNVDHFAEWMPEMIDAQAQGRLRRVRPLPLVAR